jgi:predicted RNA-binding Zn ribbon-like protein
VLSALPCLALPCIAIRRCQCFLGPAVDSVKSCLYPSPSAYHIRAGVHPHDIGQRSRGSAVAADAGNLLPDDRRAFNSHLCTQQSWVRGGNRVTDGHICIHTCICVSARHLLCDCMSARVSECRCEWLLTGWLLVLVL